jgi:hypothetical protein
MIHRVLNLLVEQRGLAKPEIRELRSFARGTVVMVWRSHWWARTSS